MSGVGTRVDRNTRTIDRIHDLSEGIVIRYVLSSDLKQTRSLATIIPEGAATRVVVAIVGDRKFMVMPSQIDDARQRTFSAQDREHAIRRDLGRCRLCGDTSQRFRIRYFPTKVTPGDIPACLVCTNCDENVAVSPSGGTPIPLDDIRASETLYRRLSRLPLVLDTKNVLTAEREGRVSVMKPRKQTHLGGTMSEKQKADNRQLRELGKGLDNQVERNHHKLAIAKAGRRAEAEREQRELMASLASEVVVSRPDGTVVTILPQYTADQLARIVRDREPITPQMRMRIFRRDRGTCRYCLGSSDVYEIDHVIPVAVGGHTVMSNLVLACQDCNGRKGASTDAIAWRPKPLSMVNQVSDHRWGKSRTRNPPETSWRGR